MNNTLTNIALEHTYENARLDFAAARDLGILSGDFDSRYWGYKGVHLLFSEIGSSRKKDGSEIGMSAIADKLARCYTMSVISAHTSPQLAVARLNSLRSFAKIIGNEDHLWFSLNRHLLNKAIQEIQASRSIATAYQRANNLVHFVAYCNNMTFRKNGVEHRLSDRYIKWRHGVSNPTRKKLDPTADLHSARRESLYEKDLHIALATARSLAYSTPSLEYTPGYYRIRLEALSFAMALGLRIGEVCTLSKNALRRDHDTGRYYAMIATEKAELPAATAIPEIWTDPLIQAYSYLFDSCHAARTRAKQIEENGFAFVYEKLSSYRRVHPLNEGQEAQLEVLGFEPMGHFFIDELVGSLSISAKELSSGGSHYGCIVNLPKVSTAKLVRWIDNRFVLWDWTSYSKSYGGYRITWEDIAHHSGTISSNLKKATWFIADFRILLKEMKNLNIFDPRASISSDTRDHAKKIWREIRTKALSNVGGAGCVAVKLTDFIDSLKSSYAGHLSAHFQEEFSVGGNKSSNAWEGNGTRIGTEKKLSEHLIVVWENQFSGRGALGILPRPIFRHDFYNFLSKKGGKATIFERLDIRNSDGVPFSIRPHDIRRWVTTALLRSGPSEAAIDLWMGRTPRQTRHYDYRTAKERAEYVRERYLQEDGLPNDALGRMVIHWQEDSLDKDQIELLVSEKLRALHYTPWGTCSRELYVSPCDKGLMCLRNFGTDRGCSSFQIDRTDKEAKQQIVKLRDRYQGILATLNIHQAEISGIISCELNTSEPLDQHIQLALDMVAGCTNALQNYGEDQN